MRSSRNDPVFFLQTEVFTKRPLLFIGLTKWPPIFLLSSLKDPFFLYVVCHRKTPTLGVVSAHPRHFHMWVPPPPGQVILNISVEWKKTSSLNVCVCEKENQGVTTGFDHSVLLHRIQTLKHEIVTVRIKELNEPTVLFCYSFFFFFFFLFCFVCLFVCLIFFVLFCFLFCFVLLCFVVFFFC